MADTLTASVRWTGKMHFEGRGEYPHVVPIDYTAPLGDGLGLRGLEMLLISLCGCSGQTVVSLLQKMRQEVRAFSVEAVGKKKDEHPKVLTEIHLEFRIQGPAIDPAAVEKAINLSEEKYCPVWAMLKGGTKISSSFTLSD